MSRNNDACTNDDLARMYAEFNKRYFHNRLPKDMVVRFHDMKNEGDDCGSTQLFWGRPAFILINKRIRWSYTLTAPTLLHEMIHVEHPEWRGHGPRFHKRMFRLAKAGALKPYW